MCPYTIPKLFIRKQYVQKTPGCGTELIKFRNSTTSASPVHCVTNTCLVVNTFVTQILNFIQSFNGIPSQIMSFLGENFKFC